VGLGPCEGAQPSFHLLKPDNTVLAGVIGTCNGIIGRQTLPVTGRYRIVVSTDKSNVPSRYGFSLRTVSPDHHFSVHLPLTVAPNTPTRGAGYVSAAGEQQFYDFSASPGTTVHIEGKCSDTCPKLVIRATKVDDASDYGFWEVYAAHGDWKLPPDGNYTIQVRSNGYVGDYGFTASQVAPQRH
jgi:hypothetical protein